MQVPATERHVQFGPFTVDLESRELSKNGQKVGLQERPFLILALLLERSGGLVTREELRVKLWPADTFVDFEHGINTAIKKLREALDDDSGHPRFVETLPKRGYRFIASVRSEEIAEPQPTPEGPATSNGRPEKQPSLTSLLLIAIGVIGVAILSTVWWQSVRPATVETRVMLAVLPFENLGADPAEDYFAEGMTEELITQLGQWNPARLGVIARTSSDIYRHANKSVAQVGNELGVDYVVEGSARRDGKQVRITAQLIQVRDQTHLWANTYNRDETNILALQNEVAGEVADQISVKVAAQRSIESQTADPIAHEDYVKGRHFWNQLNCDGFKAARPMFEDAMARDPKFAAAEASLAATYYKLADFSCVPERAEMIKKAKDAALKAIQLDGSLGHPHAVLGIIADEFDWDWKTAERELKLGTQLDPNSAIAHSWYAVISCEARRNEVCRAELRKAHQLDPVALITNIINAYMLGELRQYEDALTIIKRTSELYPDSGMLHWLAADILEQKGDHDKADEEYMKAMELYHEPAANIQRYRDSIVRDGWRGYWTLRLHDFSQRKDAADHCGAPGLYAHLQDQEQVLASLEQSYREHCAALGIINMDPLYDFVRSEPRFRAIIAGMRLQNSE